MNRRGKRQVNASSRPGRGRGPGRRFPKGNKAAVGHGRPKTNAELREAFRDHTLDARDVLVAVMNDKRAPKQARINAADRVLDRGWGSARTRLEIATPPGKPLEVSVRTPRSMTTEERQRRLAELAAAAAARAGAATSAGREAEDSE